MRIPNWLRKWLFVKVFNVTKQRGPDVIIGDRAEPYLWRWHIIPRNRVFNIYAHFFLRSDDDRALHDHPVLWNMSVILEGEYREHTIKAGGIHAKRDYSQGAIKFRGPRSAHRVELHKGPCWTLWITGPRVREWGFHCPNGWVHWKKFTGLNCGEPGPGCGE